MSVALLVLRLEISDDCEIQRGFEFTADGFKSFDENVKSLKYNYTLAEAVTESVPPTPDDSVEATVEDYRGHRNLHTISLETYNCDNFKMAESDSIDLEVLESSAVKSDSQDEESPRTVPQTTEVGTKPENVWEGQSKSREGSATSDASSDSSHPSKKTARFKTIESEEGASEEADTHLPSARPKSQSPTFRGSPTLHFYSGNPAVEKVKGILHIYKDNHMTNLAEDTLRSELICMLAVPAKLTIHDLLKFNGPCLKGIEFMRIIRDSSPNQYMVLVKFRSQMLADEYYSTYNNTSYNSIESDICHLVYVGKVEVLKESENAGFPIPGVTELPNCAVCLERMDESVDGILTILCNHAFHISCLDQWGDTSCPVCRYCQTPEEMADSRCMKCGSQESLWICLICGNIGCGRYVGLHAYRHFQETQHTYAMELGNNKVWDYIGDNYVHRLVQNKSDGKLVQVDEGGNPVQDEKVDSLNLEYTYLLTNQLESQRLYFEEKMEEMENIAIEQVHGLEEENRQLNEACARMEEKLTECLKEKQSAEKKTSHLHQRMKKAYHDLQEEKEMNRCLQENQSEWQKKVTSLENKLQEYSSLKDQEIKDLKDQLRDIMFYVEAQNKLSSATEVTQEEIQEGQVIVGAAAAQPKRSRKKTR